MSLTSPPPLKEHQQEGIAWLSRVGRGLLGDSPRSGKTAQLLLAAQGETLVIAPPHLHDTWTRQRDLWRPDLDIHFVGYSSVARRTANAQGKMLKTLPIPRADLVGPWGTVIADEAHALVNTQADWTAATAKIQTERLYMATGTPIPNWATELLMPLRMLYPGDRRFTNKRRWIDEWFDTWQPPWGGLKVVPPNPDALGPKDGVTWADFWMANGLDGYDGRMLQREVDLGVPFTEEDIEVAMTTKQAKVYKALERDYVAWMEDTGDEVSAWSDGGLHTMLHKASTGLEVLEPGNAGSGKLEVLAQLLQDAPRSPTLVFCHFRSTAEACNALARSMGLRVGMIHGGVPLGRERTRIEDAFRDGQLDVMVGTLSTVSTGLEFARAGTEIFVEHAWVPWKNEQAIKRAMVMGKTAHVHVVHLWTKGSVDIGMRSTVKGKSSHQRAALTARQFYSILQGAVA
jgi:hypothetical protein